MARYQLRRWAPYPGGLAEEHRLFYVAVTRARDQLYLYAPQRLHYHRRGRDDRHGFGQLTRFLPPEALAACDSATAAPLTAPRRKARRILPAPAISSRAILASSSLQRSLEDADLHIEILLRIVADSSNQRAQVVHRTIHVLI